MVLIGDHGSVTGQPSTGDNASLDVAGLGSIFDQLHAPHIIFEPVRVGGVVTDFIVRAVSTDACRAWGISQDDYLGLSVTDLSPTVNDNGGLAALARVAETGEPLIEPDFFYAVEAVSGQPRWYDACTVRMQGLLVSSFMDATDRADRPERDGAGHGPPSPTPAGQPPAPLPRPRVTGKPRTPAERAEAAELADRWETAASARPHVTRHDMLMSEALRQAARLARGKD
jgi:hypothetical protein